MYLRATLVTVTALAVGLFAPMTAAAQDATPAVFTGTDLDSAIRTAADKSGIVVANFTSSTSIASHNMDKFAWINKDLAGWINEHGVAVRIYVDEDSEAAEAFHITDTPTHIVFLNGEAFDRATGYMEGKELLNWFKLTQTGERRLDKARALHGDRIDEQGKVDVMARYQLARQYHQDEVYDLATEEYIWLWKYMLEFKRSMVGVRGSYMAKAINDLIEVYPEARDPFVAIRDETEARLQASPDWDDMSDWIVLNEIVGEDEKTFAWFDRIKQDPERLAAAGRVAFRVDHLFRKHERWADLGMVYPDPLEHVRSRVKMLEPDPTLSEEQQRQRAPVMLRVFIDNAVQTYAGCLAAGRDDEAQAIADYLPTVVDPDAARIAMIEMSLKAGVSRPVHLQWLSTVEDVPTGLTQEVKAALADVTE